MDSGMSYYNFYSQWIPNLAIGIVMWIEVIDAQPLI